MISKTTTTYPKVGEDIVKHILNPSGQGNNPYTMPVPKGGRGKRTLTSSKVNRGATMIHEANGPRCHIVATLYKPNAAEAGLQTRNVRILKSAVGDADFRSRKTYGQNT